MPTWTKVVVESSAGNIAQKAATAGTADVIASQGALATLATVDTAQIDNSAIETAKINNLAVTVDKIAATTITKAKLNVGGTATDYNYLATISSGTGLSWQPLPTIPTVTDTIADGNANAASSNGVFDAIAAISSITVDTSITNGSTNPVTNNAVYDALAAKQTTLGSEDIGTLLIDGGAVTLAKMANMATNSFIGRDTANTGAPEVLSATAVRAILNIEDGATADQTTVSGNAGTVTNGVYTTSTIAVNKGGTGATAKTGTGNNVLSASPTFTGTIDAAAITTSGDLTVGGTLISTETEILKVEDSMIIVNAGVGTGSTAFDGGIMVERGDNVTGTQGLVKVAGDNVGIMWDDSEGYFRFSSAASDTAFTPAGYVAQASNSTGVTPSDQNSGPLGSIHVKTSDETVYIRTA